MNKTYTLLLCLFLAACDSTISGNYSDGGVVTYDFKPKGKVSVTMFGDTSDFTYNQTDADHVKINGPKGSLSFTRQSDGTWNGPMDVKLSKISRQAN